MPLRLKIAISASAAFHLAFFVLLVTFPRWHGHRMIPIGEAGGVIWFNLNPGGWGDGGATTPVTTAGHAPASSKTVSRAQKGKEVLEKSSGKTAPPIALKPKESEGSPPAGNGIEPAEGGGQGLGTGEGAGEGPGKGPGGIGPPGTGGGGAGGEGSGILRKIRAQILRAKRYPPEARREKVEGDCGLLFQINPDGSLGSSRLTESCGNPILDEEALATIRRAAPFPYYAGPIQFRLRFSLKDR